MSPDLNVEATFGFIDIAGYTALTALHGESTAADLIDEFVHYIHASIDQTGKVHELIGDCAFVVFSQPSNAIQALQSLYGFVEDRRNFPVIRSGLHHGKALLRDNRYFGSTINIAARIAARAEGGCILGSREFIDAIEPESMLGVEIVYQGPAHLRNIPQPIDIYELGLGSPTSEFVIDPVCKMQVDINRAAGHLHFNGQPYWFCSNACVEQFSKSPDAYLNHS